jgi:hypothetical protein
MTWTAWNWINVLFVFINGYLAIDFWKEGRDGIGHFNAFASVLNASIVASRLGL